MGTETTHPELDPIERQQRLQSAVIVAAKRVQHMNLGGVGLGPSGWHEPGECHLCDALRELEEYARSF